MWFIDIDFWMDLDLKYFSSGFLPPGGDLILNFNALQLRSLDQWFEFYNVYDKMINLQVKYNSIKLYILHYWQTSIYWFTNCMRLLGIKFNINFVITITKPGRLGISINITSKCLVETNMFIIYVGRIQDVIQT